MTSAQLVADLRSDTVTRPSRPMLEAMMRAPLGDDVLGDEPTVNALQEKVAALFGKEAALFVPSGTMANQLAIRCWLNPAEALIAHEESHIILYETGGPAAISGVMCMAARGQRGMFDIGELDRLYKHEESHNAPTRLLWIENTQNRGGGAIWPIDRIEAMTRRARERGMRCHLDGARVWNAHVATGIPLATYASHFDSLSCCFSKGLGAPVGSALVGPRDMIARARRYRKMLGGSMRQSGILAAAAIYALDNSIARLREDHAKARRFAETLVASGRFEIDMESVQTNMVYFWPKGAAPGAAGSAAALEFAKHWDSRGIRMFEEGHRIRAVFHMDVSDEQADQAAGLLTAS